MIWVAVGIAIVVVGLGLLVWSRRRAPDGVASFQRQIDALSPEARRSVVDRVQELDDTSADGRGGEPRDPSGPHGSGRGVDGA